MISVVGLRQLKKLKGDEQQYMQSLIKKNNWEIKDKDMDRRDEKLIQNRVSSTLK